MSAEKKEEAHTRLAEDRLKAQILEGDVDNVSVKVFLLVKSEDAFEQARGYLERRGWPTFVFTSINKTIAAIAKEKPDFILISLNHPNGNLERLFNLLEQTFSISCVAFTELEDSSTLLKFQKLKVRHKMNGMASGTSIQRAIRKILIDKYAENTPNESGVHNTSDASGSTLNEGLISISGNKRNDNGPIVTSERRSSGQTALSSAANPCEKPPNYNESAHQGTTEHSSSTHLSDEAKKTKSNTSKKHHEKPPYALEPDTTSSTAPSKSYQQQAGKDRLTQGSSQSEEANVGNLNQNRQGLPNRNKASDTLNKGAHYHRPSAQRRASTDLGLHKPVIDPPNKRDKAYHPEGPQLASKAKRAPDSKPQGSASRSLSAEESDLYKSFDEALESIDKKSEGALYEPLQLVSTLGVIPIETESLAGFILVSINDADLLLQEDTLAVVESTIKGKMKLNAPDQSLQDSFLLEIPEVDFITWGKEHAAFMFSIPYCNHELCVAFLPTINRFPCRKSSQLKDMAKINIDDISPSQAVTFKTYIYLEKNRKRLLYLRDGRLIMPEQKQKLMSNSFSGFHIEESDIHKFKAYLASTMIHELIESFRS